MVHKICLSQRLDFSAEIFFFYRRISFCKLSRNMMYFEYYSKPEILIIQ